MLSRPLACWAAGMVKIPLITARRPDLGAGSMVGLACELRPEWLFWVTHH
jgi:hypothetical protein